MRVMIDACVLYPTVMREVVLGVAAAGLFEPRWSPRILEEWARATAKLGLEQEVWARGEIAALSPYTNLSFVVFSPALCYTFCHNAYCIMGDFPL